MGRKTALVTGASSGLGVDLARDLAARGYDVALTARSERPMQELAAELKSAHGVAATVHPADLSASNSVEALVKSLDDQGVTVDVLVANAAFGMIESFVDHEPARLTAMLQLNMVSLAELALTFGRRMWHRGAGHILLVSSGAAYQPTPSMAAYGATKAFISSLGEALNVELGPKVGVTVVAPGPMETGFNVVTGFKPPPALQRMNMPTDKVASIGLDAMFAGRPAVIPGRLNNVAAFSNRLMSRQSAAKMFLKMSKGH